MEASVVRLFYSVQNGRGWTKTHWAEQSVENGISLLAVERHSESVWCWSCDIYKNRSTVAVTRRRDYLEMTLPCFLIDRLSRKLHFLFYRELHFLLYRELHFFFFTRSCTFLTLSLLKFVRLTLATIAFDVILLHVCVCLVQLGICQDVDDAIIAWPFQ